MNDPLYVQYGFYLKGLLEGNWGISRSAGNLPVWQAIKAYFPATLELSILAIVIAFVVALPLGVLSAIRRNRPIDTFTRIFSVSGVSIPIFWLALLLQYFLYFRLKVAHLPYLPLGGRIAPLMAQTHAFHSITGFYMLDSLLQHNWAAFLDVLEHLLLPAGTLAFASLGLLTRVTRSSMLEVLGEDYVQVARSKGLPERRVILQHALRNGLLPIVTVAGLQMGSLLSGAILVETVFFFPGIGFWAVNAITSSDSATIMAFVLLVALVRSILNLFTDFSYALLDPRVRID